MCGRYAMSTMNPAAVPRAVSKEAAWGDSSEAAAYIPREQVRPTTYAPVAFAAASAPSVLRGEGPQPEVLVRSMRWGLVPSFAQPDYISQNPPLINARGESVLQKPSFRCISAKSGSRRCVVITTGYYEWYTYPQAPGPAKGRPPPKKIPYLVGNSEPEGLPTDDEELCEKHLLVAGVYDTWNGASVDEEARQRMPHASFAIVTMSANPEIDWLHHRQPVFLTTEQALSAWLDPNCPPDRACEIALASSASSRGLKWTRMVKDLSAPDSVQGKPKKPVRIAAIDSFFSTKRGGLQSTSASRTGTSVSKQSNNVALPSDDASEIADIVSSPLKRPRPSPNLGEEGSADAPLSPSPEVGLDSKSEDGAQVGSESDSQFGATSDPASTYVHSGTPPSPRLASRFLSVTKSSPQASPSHKRRRGISREQPSRLEKSKQRTMHDFF